MRSKEVLNEQGFKEFNEAYKYLVERQKISRNNDDEKIIILLEKYVSGSEEYIARVESIIDKLPSGQENVVSKKKQELRLIENNLGMVCIRAADFFCNLERFEEAQNYLDKSKKLDFQNYMWFNTQGTILLRSKKIDEAKEAFNNALKYKKDHSKAYLGLSRVFYYQNKFKEALGMIDRALEIDNKLEELHYFKALVLNAQSEYQSSLKSCEKALKLNNNNAFIYNLKAMNLRALERIDDALECYKLGIKLFHKYSKFYNNIANICITKGNYDEAIKNYQYSLSINNSIFALYGLSNIHILRKEYDKALEKFLRITASYKSEISHEEKILFTQSFARIGDIYLSKSKYLKAIEYYLKALELKPDDKFIQFNLAEAYREFGKIEESRYWIDQLSDREYFEAMELNLLDNLSKNKDKIELPNSEGQTIITNDFDENHDQDHLNKPIESDNKKQVRKAKIDALERRIEKKMHKELKKQTLTESTLVVNETTDSINFDEFYRVSHPNNILSELRVKIDWKSDSVRRLEYNIKESFRIIAEQKRFVGGENQQGHKFIGKNELELKILGGNGKGDIRIKGAILKDPITKIKYCILSQVVDHKETKRSR